MFGSFLFDQLPQDYAKVMTTDGPAFNRFFHAMLDKGVYYAPALYATGFISAEHTAADIEETVDAAAQVLGALKLKRYFSCSCLRCIYLGCRPI